MFVVVILLRALATALPHSPGVPVDGVLLSVVACVETAFPVLFELAVPPLLAVLVLFAGAAAGLSGAEFVLRRSLLQIAVARVLLGVVVSVKTLVLPQVTNANQTQQQ